MINNQNEKFKVWRDEENQIIRAKFWGEQDEASAGARKKFVEIAKLEKIRKEAQFGAKLMTRVMTSFVIRFAGVTNSKTFATEEESLKWLKE